VLNWAITVDGIAVCRDCLSVNTELQIDPLLDPSQLLLAKERAEYAAKYGQDPQFAEYDKLTDKIIERSFTDDDYLSTNGICVRCHKNHTRRVSGYCVKCRDTLLIGVHGGAGAFREDKYGRRFITLPTRQAKYTWGVENIPVHASIESDVIKWKAQAQYMWEFVVEKLEQAMRIASTLVRPPITVDDVADKVTIAIGRGLLSFDLSKEKDIDQYVLMCVRNDINKYISAEQKRMYRECAVSQLDREKTKSIELLFKNYDFSRPKVIRGILEIGLEDWEFKLLRAWVIEEKTQEEIGIMFGVTKQCIHTWIKRIHNKYADRAQEILDEISETEFIEPNVLED
jgi:DNA-directed RNA polymerase specialized sigma subunit